MEEQLLSKKERKALVKEQKREEQDKKVMAEKVKKFLVWVFAAGFILFVGFKTWNWIKTPTPQVAGDTIEVKSDDWIKGDREAKVTLIEYGDFQCPACATYYFMTKKIAEDIPSGFKTVYRHFPLITIHKNAFAAAQAAEAAGAQGKFWEMHDLLYEKQSEWSEEGNAKDKFVGYAKEIGLDENKFKEDFDKSETKDKIEAQIAQGTALGINATPTFYLNGTKIQPKSYEEFKKLIEDQIKGYSVQ